MLRRASTAVLVVGATAGAAAGALWAYKRWSKLRVQAAATGGEAAAAAPPAATTAEASAATKRRGAQQEQSAAEENRRLQQEQAAAAEQRRQQEQREAEARRRASPLYRVTQNEHIVHEMLLSGQEGGLAFLEPFEAAPPGEAPVRMAAGRRSPAAGPAPTTGAGVPPPPPPPSEAAAAAAEARAQVVATVERAFFDSLVEGLRRGDTRSLASLLLDSRDQLAGMVAHSAAGEARQLVAELREKLDEGYVMQHLQRWDAPYAAQCFDFLVHAIAQLQAPARREATQAAYADVASLFSAAVAAEAQGAAAATPAAAPAAPAVSLGQPGAAPSGDRVQLRLSYGAGGDAVAVQLEAQGAPAPSISASSSGGSSSQDLQWRLQLVPGPDGEGVVAVLAPVDASADSNSTEQPSSSSGSGSGGICEASVEAAVAAARFMHHQLNELKSDVAAARLAVLKKAILGDGSAIEYERQRYLRALQQPPLGSSGATAAAAGGAGTALADAFPLTLAWLKEVLQQAPPPPGLAGPALVQAAVESGMLLLLQRTTAVGPADCPETLLLDLEAIVILQSELQRICLVAAALLIVQQILSKQRALPPAGSPAHAALCERVAQRVGVLLSSGANMEALCLELHQQINSALAEAGPPSQAAAAGAAAGEGVGAGAGEAGAQAVQQQQQRQGPGGAVHEVELAVVTRMTERTFSTDDMVYKRVQAGIVAAATALLRSTAAAAPGARAAELAGPPDTWKKMLRGVQVAEVAPDVRRLAATVHRIAAVSTAVAGSVVYTPLLQKLQAGASERQRRRH